MGIISTQSSCTICDTREAVMHSHHTVPQSRNGKDSRQIILCPTCHNSLHANAVFLISQIRGNKIRKPKSFWKSVESEQQDQPFLRILVEALIAPLPKGLERAHTITSSVQTSVFEDLKMLQLDIGASSMEKTLAYCILFTLQSKGISNVNQSKEKSSMWFMQLPNS